MLPAPISVVIPTFNRSRIVRDAIDSVLAQTRPPAEIIVIDDGSKDDTAQSLSDYAGKISYCFQPNAGLSAARNHGIRLATQQFVAFLDDDDVWHPRKLEFQMRCFERDPDLALVGTEQFDWPTAEFAPVAVEPKARPINWEQLVVRTLIPVSSVVVRRDIIKAVGDFDVTLRSSEDKDFFLRVAACAPIAMLNAALTGYRDTPGSMCKNPLVREDAMRRILNQLSQQSAWRRSAVLRRKAYSCMHLGCADIRARCGQHREAAVRLIKSMAYYPFPLSANEVRLRFERPRRLAVNLLRMMHLKQPEASAPVRSGPARHALSDVRIGLTQTL